MTTLHIKNLLVKRCTHALIQQRIISIISSAIHNFLTEMDRHQWKKIDKICRSSAKPPARWGHASCIVDDNLYFFGGYADSTYMNDLWIYQSSEMQWTEVKTHGDIPACRSNSTLNYDSVNHRLVLFGGGGSNKQRFNSISLLNLNTKEWLQIPAPQNQPAPWQRTYHVAECIFPYLIVFGGECLDDVGDLWVFDFINMHWKEVIQDHMEVKPVARRFHASVLLGQQMYIVAGCYGKYRCLSDIYSLDLSILLKTGDPNQLKWVEKNATGLQYLPRWGHTLAAYNNRIYIFGGRFSNDLNDLLLYNPEVNSLKLLKTGGEIPTARRRHCAGFIGSSMVMFGGFDCNYYQDFYYINMFQLSKKQLLLQKGTNLITPPFNPNNGDCKLQSIEGENIYLQRGVISKHFISELQMNEFIKDINQTYTKKQLISNIQCLYRGFGILHLEQDHKKYQISLPDDELDPIQIVYNMINKQHKLKLISNKSIVVVLSFEQFNKYLQFIKNHWFADVTLVVNHSSFIKCNKALLSSRSKYFRSIFSKNFYQKQLIDVEIEESSVVFEIMLNYLNNGILVVPETFYEDDWMSLYRLAEYFCLEKLAEHCQIQLCEKVTTSNFSRLLNFSSNFNLESLSLHCGYTEMKTLIQKIGFKLQDLNIQMQKVKERESKRKHGKTFLIYEQLKFHLLHLNEIKGPQQIGPSFKNKSHEPQEEDKENTEVNSCP